MPGVLDCHTHLYPPEVQRDPAAWGAAHGEPWWGLCVAPPGRTSLQGWADIPRLLADMDRAGVEKCVMLGWYWERQETCELQNRWYADWVRRHPDRLLGFAAVHPDSGERGLDDVRRSLDAGLCGIGELHPGVQGSGLAGPGWRRVAELALERRVPVNLHVTDPVAFGPGSTSRATPLEGYLALAGEFPGVTFILAHWGGGLPFHELTSRVRAALRNVVYDSAASPLLYEPSVYRRVADLVGAERILFGTDYPLLCHPRATREPGFERSLADARASGLSEAELGLALGGNLRRVLGLG
jgi:predicted TIM-barrel fold metal-dependent hydrolase